MVVTSAFLFAAALAASVIEADANAFLGQRRQVTKELVEQTLLSELASAANSARIATIQEELRPTYASLPKNEQGQLESSTVRYALHRYFVQKHGWYVKGLDPAGGSWNSSSSASIVTDLAPSYIQGLFEEQLHSRGLKLEELAVFAATLSDLIHSEGVKSLQGVYQALELPTGGSVAEADFDLALRGFLAEVIIAQDARVTDAKSVAVLEEEARGISTDYDDLVMWTQDVRLTRGFAEQSRRNPFVMTPGVSVEEADDLMYELYHKFGSLARRECATVKGDLLKSEIPGTGRVPLSRFYAIDSNPLRESVDYIRNMGALDEANAGSPLVVIPNYMSGPSRCMPFSGYFSVCCPDDCENVLGGIERAIAGPSAEPHQLAEVVSHLPSDTESAPRNLSALLLSRLDDIASGHRGRVPLHGRLFMQWLHHAYPRQCPYPHAAGTIKPVSQDEWLAMHDLEDVLASSGEMEEHVSTRIPERSSLEALPWTNVEELVAVHKTQAGGKSLWDVRSFAMLVAVISFALPLVRASVLLVSPGPEDKAHFV